MAYNEEVAARIRSELAQVDVVERKMFGGLCFTRNGHMAVGVMKDHIVLRLGEEGTTEGLREPHTAPMDFTGRVLKSMLYVHPPGFDGDALGDWIGRALTFVDTLPPK